MRALARGLLLLTILAVASPAWAQMGPPAARKARVPTAEQIERKRQADELDRKYKATLKKTDPASGTTDPWANMRGAAPTKP